MLPYFHLLPEDGPNRVVTIDKEFWDGPSLIPRFYQRNEKYKKWQTYSNRSHAKNDIKTSKATVFTFVKYHNGNHLIIPVIYRLNPAAFFIFVYIKQKEILEKK